MNVMLIFFTIMGVSRCIVLLLVPVVIADTVKPEKFSAACGIVMLMFGIFTLIMGPVIGKCKNLYMNVWMSNFTKRFKYRRSNIKEPIKKLNNMKK